MNKTATQLQSSQKYLLLKANIWSSTMDTSLQYFKPSLAVYTRIVVNTRRIILIAKNETSYE